MGFSSDIPHPRLVINRPPPPPPPRPPTPYFSRELSPKIADCTRCVWGGRRPVRGAHFLNFRSLVAIAMVVIILRRGRCESRRFERHLIPPTCGRFAPGWELAAAAASACARKRTEYPHPPETIIIIRWSRHPRSYPRAKCFQRRYCAIILASGTRRVARPLVLRRIGEARIRPDATSDAEATVSVLPKRARGRPRECAGDRYGLRMVSSRGIQAVSFRIPHRIWHVRTSCTFPPTREY